MRRPAECSEEGCTRQVVARGLCDTDYRRWRRTTGLGGWPSAEHRFWAAVRRSDDTSCWLWTAWTDAYGYGGLSVDGKAKKAHRYAYELLVGPIPDGLSLDHLCRVRNCVNPDHLEPVTRGENVRRGNAPSHVKRRGHLALGRA